MTITSDAPADTTMMRIVHDALRRDLARASATLARPERASGEQRRAIGAHLTWMMRFLHAHHASEDDGLYPLVRERAGAAAEMVDVLDRMARQHEAIAPAVAAVETAAMALAADGSDDATQQMRPRSTRSPPCSSRTCDRRRTRPCPSRARLITAAEWQATREAAQPRRRSRCPSSGSRVTGSSTAPATPTAPP